MSAQPAFSCTTWNYDATVGNVTGITSHTILTANSPGGQYEWDQISFNPSWDVTKTYDRTTADTGFVAWQNGNIWDPATQNNQNNGLKLQLDGAFDNVSQFVLLNDVSFPSGQNDGIRNFTLKLYDSSNVLLGTHTYNALNQEPVQVFNFGTTYNNVASFDLVVNTTFTRGPIQIREIALGSTTGLSCTQPPLSMLNVTKTASAAGFVTGNVQQAPAGTVVTYTYVITNVGNTTLNGIAINDAHGGENTPPNPNIETANLTDNGTAGDSTNPVSNGLWDTLGPGDVLTLTSSYTISQADMDLHQ